jgi:hypothetical protein
MTPVTLVVVSCLLQFVISSIASMLCPPRLSDRDNQCMSISLANSSNCVITIVVILILLRVIPMPGGETQ